MNSMYTNFPTPKNEPILSYAPGSKERVHLKRALKQLKSEVRHIPSLISGQEIHTDDKMTITPPHEINHQLGTFSLCSHQHIERAISGALDARSEWANMAWKHRASIFLKAANLLATTYRYEINAATMLGQSKTVIQAEIDSACELIDFLRFNVHYLDTIYKQQPLHDKTVYNRLEYRPLEGFVLAVTPFNFTAIGANLAVAPAMCGNVVIWKPSYTQVYSAWVTMKVLREAGLPDGVIQFVLADGQVVGDQCIEHKDFAGLHFTGSTTTFNLLWKKVASQIDELKTYPRIVGETGGKDFVFVHPTGSIDVAITALARGAYEFQGQKCSAASRAYLPKSLASQISSGLSSAIKTMKMGSVEDFSNFISAVIDEKSFNKIVDYIEKIKSSNEAKIIVGGKSDKRAGYFIEPTLVETSNPQFLTMCEEIFGPILTYYVYDDDAIDEVIRLLDTTSSYALTGAIIASDRYAIADLSKQLVNAAGNFYINDKPTGAVVGQQPFGGARKSGTNDKAGSMLNLYRWLSPRTIKESSLPAISYAYSYMD